MNLDLTTPALFFPAISLLLLAYTNRFVTLANVIRQLHADEKRRPDPLNLAQIDSLRRRLKLIRLMQEFGVASMLVCVVTMGTLFAGWIMASKFLFIISLLFFAVSLVLSIWEIHLSSQALDIRLSDMEEGGV